MKYVRSRASDGLAAASSTATPMIVPTMTRLSDCGISPPVPVRKCTCDPASQRERTTHAFAVRARQGGGMARQSARRRHGQLLNSGLPTTFLEEIAMKRLLGLFVAVWALVSVNVSPSAAAGGGSTPMPGGAYQLKGLNGSMSSTLFNGKIRIK